MKTLPADLVEFYEFIEQEYSLENSGPSIRQLETQFGLSSGHVQGILKLLEGHGWIRRTPRVARGIVPIKEPRVHYRRSADV